MPKKNPWKKNFLKIPKHILGKLEKLSTNNIVVSSVKKIPVADIKASLYEHLGILININDEIIYPSKVVPFPYVGRYSKTNAFGKEKIRRDLPKISKTYTFEAPNFGDESKGYHDVTWTKQVYHRDFIFPKELEICIELMKHDEEAGNFYFKFSVEEILYKNELGFESDLLHNLNLLQENTGICDIYDSESSRGEYLKTLYVDWVILPPSEASQLVEIILNGKQFQNQKLREQLIERINLLESLKPIQLIRGASGFRRYFGAQFNDNLVVFENIDYGNAIYIMFDDWVELSQKSRYELLLGFNEKFVRIEHRLGWESKLYREIQSRGKDS